MKVIMTLINFAVKQMLHCAPSSR